MLRKPSPSVRVFYPKFDTAAVVAALVERLGELQRLLPLKLVVLFGSYARGNYTVASDIDLLVVYSGKAREDAYSIAWETLRLPRLEPHVYSEAQYCQQQATIDKMIAGGIHIFPRDRKAPTASP